MLNFRDEAAYKAYLAKCQKERDASEDIAFRNHGEYIKYLTKIKEKARAKLTSAARCSAPPLFSPRPE